jgi:hypothetical protein
MNNHPQPREEAIDVSLSGKLFLLLIWPFVWKNS